jgi:hypothetical protein
MGGSRPCPGLFIILRRIPPELCCGEYKGVSFFPVPNQHPLTEFFYHNFLVFFPFKSSYCLNRKGQADTSSAAHTGKFAYAGFIRSCSWHIGLLLNLLLNKFSSPNLLFSFFYGIVKFLNYIFRKKSIGFVISRKIRGMKAVRIPRVLARGVKI